jgi:hypothetical protein
MLSRVVGGFDTWISRNDHRSSLRGIS